MIGKWRRWNSHLGQIGKRGDHSWLAAKGSWCDIVLHCIALLFRTSGKVKSSRQGLQNLVSKTIFKDGCLNPIKEVLWLLFTCMALHRHLSKRKDTIWCWRLFLSETCIGFTMHIAHCTMWQRQRCMWSVLAAHFLAVHLALHFVSMSFFCKNQYPPNSIWQLLYMGVNKNYVRIMSGKFVLYHPIWIAFEIAFLKGSSNFKCFLTVHTTEFLT